MLYIRTGKMGHGKTLNTIREVDIYAHSAGRIVYYHNINGLKPETLKAQWFEFEDPEKWFGLPDDAVIVVDEAQNWFGVRDPRTRPPEHITRFETMRHQGHEVHLVTQDPRQLDVNVRRLCNGHIHYWRVFKSSQLIRFESEVVVEKVEVKSSFKDADKKTLRLDKNYFTAYTSTNAKHHFQTKLPTKFILAALVIIVAAVLVYRVYGRYTEGAADGAAAESSGSGQSVGVVDSVRSTVGGLLNPIGASGSADMPLTLGQYLENRAPRVRDIPASAPIYDQLATPQTFPRPVCIASSDSRLLARNRPRMEVEFHEGSLMGCRCNTQQGTRLDVSFQFCISVVENGYFDDTRPDSGSLSSERSQQRHDPPPSFQSAEYVPRPITTVGGNKPGHLW